VAKSLKVGLLHRTVARRKEDEFVFFFESRTASSVRTVSPVVGYQLPTCLPLPLRPRREYLVNLEPEDAAGVGEDQNIALGRCQEQMARRISSRVFIPGAAGAAAALHSVGRDRCPLHVAVWLTVTATCSFGDQVFQLDLGRPRLPMRVRRSSP